MTKKGRNAVLIISGVLVTGTIAWIIYNRKKKESEVELILAKIGEAKTENQGDVNIAENLFKKNLLDVKKNPLPAGVKIFNNKGSEDSWKEAVKLAKDLKTSIEGGGTNETLFYSTLSKIKSVLEWQMVNNAYTLLTKRMLYKDMLEEAALRKGAVGIVFSNQDESVLFVDKLASYLKNLPTYRF
jgi:hypothetical protein